MDEGLISVPIGTRPVDTMIRFMPQLAFDIGFFAELPKLQLPVRKEVLDAWDSSTGSHSISSSRTRG